MVKKVCILVLFIILLSCPVFSLTGTLVSELGSDAFDAGYSTGCVGSVNDLSSITFNLDEFGEGVWAVYRYIILNHENAFSSYLVDSGSPYQTAFYSILFSSGAASVSVDVSGETGITSVGLYVFEWDADSNKWGNPTYFYKAVDSTCADIAIEEEEADGNLFGDLPNKTPDTAENYTTQDAGSFSDLSSVSFDILDFGDGVWAVYRYVILNREDSYSDYKIDSGYPDYQTDSFSMIIPPGPSVVSVDLSSETVITEIGVYAFQWDSDINGWSSATYFYKKAR